MALSTFLQPISKPRSFHVQINCVENNAMLHEWSTPRYYSVSYLKIIDTDNCYHYAIICKIKEQRLNYWYIIRYKIKHCWYCNCTNVACQKLPASASPWSLRSSNSLLWRSSARFARRMSLSQSSPGASSQVKLTHGSLWCLSLQVA